MEIEFVILWLACLLIAELIARGKGQANFGLLLAFFLGPLGVIITLCLPNRIAATKEKAERDLREQELALQKEILRELRAARKPAASATPRELAVEEFIPDNLRSPRRR